MESELAIVHVGKAIEKRRQEIKISKSELSRRIGVPQQHINRILERETIDTNRLVQICQALDFNFFTLFCPNQRQIYANNSAFSIGNGNSSNWIGNNIGIAAESKSSQEEVANLMGNINLLNNMIQNLEDQVANLKSNLKDKDTIIELLKERR